MVSQQLTTVRPRLGGALLVPLAFVALVLLVYLDPLTTGRMFVGRDLVPYGLPMEKATHDAWARGRLPVWNDDVSGGRPILPNPNAGVLYPVRPLLARLPFAWAMRLFPLLHWAWAGVGMILLLRALGVSDAAAWVGAATFVFSGVSVSQVFYQPIGPAVAWHPWLLWALVRPARPPVRAALLGLLWGVLFLLGDAFAVAVALLAAGLWIALEVPPEARRRLLGALAAGWALGLLLAAPQIAATLLLVAETHRAVVGFPLREVFGFTLSPWRLLELAVPYPFGDAWTLEDAAVWGRGVFRCLDVTVYAGSFATMALVTILRAPVHGAIFRAPVHGATLRAPVRGARMTRSLFFAGTALAVVGSFVPAAWGDIHSFVPLRYPEKLAVATTLALALAAGLAFDRFKNGVPRPVWFLAGAVVLTLAAAGAAIFPERAAAAATAAVGATAARRGEAAAQLPGALAEAGLLWIAAVIALELLRKRGQARVAACVILLTAVPILANRRIAPTESEASVLAPTAFARAIARRDAAGGFRTLDESSYRAATPLQEIARRTSPWGTEWTRLRWDFHAPVLWSRGTVFNADPDRGDLARIDSLRTVSSLAAVAPMAERFFGALALRWGIRFRDQGPLPGFHRFGGDAIQNWDENPAASADLRLLERWREEAGAVAGLAALPRLAAGEIVLETGREGEGRARAGALRVLEKSPERITLEASAPEPTWLFALRGYWSHRTVTVDGAPVDCVPAQLGFSAVPVPAGTHLVDWRENAPGFETARWGPVLFALVAALLLLRRGRATISSETVA